MLARHALAYLPSLIIPALAAFAAIFLYTRVLSPSDFGYYTLALNAMTLLTAFGYYWLQTSLPRLLPEAIREGREQKLLTTCYGAYGLVSLLLVVLLAAFWLVKEPEQLRTVILLAGIMAMLRALLNIHQSRHRCRVHIRRYNVIECGQAVLGLGIGLVLAVPMGYGANGAIVGGILGMLLVSLVDARFLLQLSPGDFDRQSLKDICRFGLPLVLAYGIITFLSVSDRFLLEHFKGAAELGVYAAGYTLMERIITMLFMVIAVPSFPLTINKLEQGGVEAARQQTYQNGVGVLLLAMPACAGLMLSSEHLAFVLIGPEFRQGALQVMPYIALSAIMGGMATHYFDHAFYLAKKSRLLLWTQGPAALLNLILNLLWIPQYGFMGAAYANVVAYALLLLLSIVVGRSAFAVAFPFLPALQIALSTAVMTAIILYADFPVTLAGLVLMVVAGGGGFGLCVLALNVAGIRSKILPLKQ